MRKDYPAGTFLKLNRLLKQVGILNELLEEKRNEACSEYTNIELNTTLDKADKVAIEEDFRRLKIV